MGFVFGELLLAYLGPFMIVYLRVAICAFFLLAYAFAFHFDELMSLNFVVI